MTRACALYVSFATLFVAVIGVADQTAIERHLHRGDFAAAAQAASSISDSKQRLAAFQSVARAAFRDRSGEGAAGGAAQADFDTLIDLITTTISPETWDELGGSGNAAGFPGGVYVDTRGLLNRLSPDQQSRQLDVLRRLQARKVRDHYGQGSTKLRFVSLVQLERELQRRIAAGQEPDDWMRYLAGIYRVEYLLIDEETRDVILAGPADDWQLDNEGRVVTVTTGEPVLHLDDLVVMLRNAYDRDGRFGCSITPRKENLSAAQAYLKQHARRPLKPGGRDRWIAGLREKMGHQDIEVRGIPAGTHAARILVEADYRMKLVGMGLERGVPGVVSYLEMVELDENGNLPKMSVLRWWFTLNYDQLTASAELDAFAWKGQGVQVLSENELLKATGQRVHTGRSDDLNQRFARSFTEHFAALAKKYPVYGELRNVFDLALVAALIREHDLPPRVNWEMEFFRTPADGQWFAYQPLLTPAPVEVESVVSFREVNKRQIVAGVSGGVEADTRQLVRRQPCDMMKSSLPFRTGESRNWWWDADQP